MKTFLICAMLLVAGCASNPMLTGKPQHWKGRTTEELLTGLGQPSKVIPQADASEIWVYSRKGDYLAPAEESTKFRMGGGGGESFFGAAGGINTQKQGERVTDYENVWRFLVRKGKVRKWYAQRFVGGQLVWEDH